MNVQLSLERASGVLRRVRRENWRGVFAAAAIALAGTGYAAAASNAAATQTALTVASDSAGPRTKLTLKAHVAALDGGEAAAGVVNFHATGASGANTDLGSAVLDANGDAVLTTNNLAPGSFQLAAVYQGDAAHQASVSATSQVQAEATSSVAGFTVTASPTSLNATAGSFATSVVTVTPVNGFNSTMNTYVSLSCGELPFGATCTFSPTNVLAACTAQACPALTSTLQIQTLAPGTASLRQGGEGGSGSKAPAYALVFPALFGLAGAGTLTGRKSTGRLLRNVVLLCLTGAAAMGIMACNPRYYYLNRGPIANTGTPNGTYTIPINSVATVGSSIITPPTSPQLVLTVSGGTTTTTPAITAAH